MNPAELALEGIGWLIEHADIVKAVGEAITAGTPKEAIQAGIRGVMLRQSEDALREELLAADGRKAGSQGQRGYEAYAAFTGGKTFDGRDMPTWDQLSDRIKGAWEAAADAIRTA